MDHSIRSFKGKSPDLGQRVYVDPQSTVIGDVVLGDDVSVWPGAVIRGDMHSIKVCLLYTSPSPRDRSLSRMPSSA